MYILYYIILYFIILYYIILYYIILYYIILYYFILDYIILLYYIILYYIILYHIISYISYIHIIFWLGIKTVSQPRTISWVFKFPMKSSWLRWEVEVGSSSPCAYILSWKGTLQGCTKEYPGLNFCHSSGENMRKCCPVTLMELLMLS